MAREARRAVFACQRAGSPDASMRRLLLQLPYSNPDDGA